MRIQENAYAKSAYKTESAKKEKEKQQNQTVTEMAKEEAAAVYKKSDATVSGVTKKADRQTIQKMQQEAEEKTAALRNLVENMMSKQGKAVVSEKQMYAELRAGNLEVEESVVEQAKKDVSEDGYWGAEQTSERMVSFAKALSGNDPAKADVMIAAVKKGFEQATKSWGDELPALCKDTLDLTLNKLESWKAGEQSDQSKFLAYSGTEISEDDRVGQGSDKAFMNTQSSDKWARFHDYQTPECGV